MAADLKIILTVCDMKTPFFNSFWWFTIFYISNIHAAENNENKLQFEQYYEDKPVNNNKMQAKIDELGSNVDLTKRKSVFDAGGKQKKKVGVIYQDEEPIGILQPYKRSYRFIPVNEEEAFKQTNELVKKREIVEIPDDSYPSILTKFKIATKLHNKRNFIDSITDNNMQELKSTIRKLRSNPDNSDQIEEELKNILDDMGLIEKREVYESDEDEDEAQGEKTKRDNEYLDLTETEDAPSASRRKRHKEDLEDNLVLNSPKTPLVNAAETDCNDEANYEKQIESRIETLKQKVKRDMNTLKNEDPLRNKRDLIAAESPDIDPSVNLGGPLKALTRRKRSVSYFDEQKYDDYEEKGFHDYEPLVNTQELKRRRRNENEDRPQQLSDLSDLDLFGALPKSYNGELSRSKRIKRK